MAISASIVSKDDVGYKLTQIYQQLTEIDIEEKKEEIKILKEELQKVIEEIETYAKSDEKRQVDEQDNETFSFPRYNKKTNYQITKRKHVKLEMSLIEILFTALTPVFLVSLLLLIFFIIK